MTLLRHIGLIGLVFSFALGCATPNKKPVKGPNQGLKVIVAAQSATNCTPSESETGTFPGDVDHFVVKVTGENVDFETTVSRDEVDSHGEILVQGVPPGDELTLDLLGCSTTDGLTWAGRASDVTIQPNTKTAPGLYFTKKEVFNCTKSSVGGQYGQQSMSNAGYAFGATARTAKGTILLTGGFGQADNATVVFFGGSSKSVLELVASSSLVEYRPSSGVFAPWSTTLTNERGLHHALPYDGGNKVLIVGGITRAHVQTTPWAPVGPASRTGTSQSGDPLTANAEGYEPDGTDSNPVNILPNYRLEVVDVLSRSITEHNPSGFKNHILPLNAVAQYSDESFVLSGGMQHDGSPATQIVQLRDIAQVLSGDQATFKGTLKVARMGHTMTPFSNSTNQLALVLGGNFDTTDTTSNTNVAELIVLPNPDRAETTISSQIITNNTAIAAYATGFHQTVLIDLDLKADCSASFLVAGGVEVTKKSGTSNTMPQYSYRNQLPERLDRIDLNSFCTPALATMTITSLLSSNEANSTAVDSKRMKRALHSLTDLGDNMVLVGGGYNLMGGGDTEPYCDEGFANAGCFFSDTLLMDVVTVNATFDVLARDTEPALTFSRPRFGHSSVLLPDGTLLAVGGLSCSTDSSCLQKDAEIFNPLRPGEAAHCSTSIVTPPPPGPDVQTQPVPDAQMVTDALEEVEVQTAPDALEATDTPSETETETETQAPPADSESPPPA